MKMCPERSTTMPVADFAAIVLLAPDGRPSSTPRQFEAKVEANSQTIAAVLTVVATIVSAGLSAFLGAWLALRRYRSERWFDRKLAMYTAVFDAMNELYEEMDQLMDEEIHPNVGLTPKYRTALATASAKARLRLRKASRLGAFTISREAEAILVRLLGQLDQAVGEEGYFDILDKRAATISAGLAELKTAARRDLNS